MDVRLWPITKRGYTVEDTAAEDHEEATTLVLLVGKRELRCLRCAKHACKHVSAVVDYRGEGRA